MNKKLSNITAVFDALSNETRLKIFLILVKHCKNGIIPTEISKLMNDFPRNTLSFHLSLMENAGICESERQGKQIFYKAKCGEIRKIANFLLADCCNDESCDCKGGCEC